MTDQNGFVPSDYDNAQNSISSQPAGGVQGALDLSGESPAADNTMNASETVDTTGAQDWAEKAQAAPVYSSYYAPQGMPYASNIPQPKKTKLKKEKKPHRGAWLALVVACAFVFSFAGGAAGYAVMQNGLPFFNAEDSTAKDSSAGDSVLQTGDGSAAAATTASEVTELSANSVVEITTENVTTGSFFQQQIQTGAGSGVIVTADGYIVTNNHVIEDSDKITVTLRDGTQYEAQLIGTDEKTDLAVLKIEASGLQPAVFGSSSDLKVKDRTAAQAL